VTGSGAGADPGGARYPGDEQVTPLSPPDPYTAPDRSTAPDPYARPDQPAQPGTDAEPDRQAYRPEGAVGAPDPYPPMWAAPSTPSTPATPPPPPPGADPYGAGHPTDRYPSDQHHTEAVDITPAPTVAFEPAPAPATSRRRGRGAAVALLLTVALLVGLLGGVVGSWLMDRQRTATLTDRTVSLPASQQPAGGGPQQGVAGVAAAVLPSVVALRVSGGNGQGTGSGFVIDARGYLLTNNHVVSAAAEGGTISVVFQDGSQTRATIVGRDPSYDLAVLKADVGNRRALVLGDSERTVVGDPVIAIGAPLGLQGTVTTGIVSAKNRPVTAGDQGQPAFINAIQTDAAINPGNSGGPLVDASGTVIGINSAIARAPGNSGVTGGNIGLGFAIPSNQARRTAEQLIRTGKSEHPIVGILLDRDYAGEGVKVTQTPVDGQPPITPGGPAEKAGVRPGDVIVAVNGRPVAEPDELIVAIRSRAVGETITLTIRRDGGEREVRVTLAAAAG